MTKAPGEILTLVGGACPPLDPFWRVDVGVRKWLFTCPSTLLLKLVEAIFEIAELAASIEKGATEEEVLKKVANNRELNALPRQSFSDT